MTTPLHRDEAVTAAETPAAEARPWWARGWFAPKPRPAIVVKRRGGAAPAVPGRYHVAHVHVVGPGRAGLRLRQLERLAVQLDARAIILGEAFPPVMQRELADLAKRVRSVLVIPAAGSPMRGDRARLVWVGDQPLFEVGARVPVRMPLRKRLVDLVGSVTGLVVLAPVLLVIAAIIRLDSPGPVLFAQPRAGWHGRRFRMLKFRTMHQGADAAKATLAHLNASGDPRLFKIPDDPRVTRAGRVLRRWSLDELPQLWNVLVGDMSLVGPRPFFESDLQDYEAHHFRRLTVKPVITGNWQVRGRSEIVHFEEVVRLDREYIERWSLWLDFTIMARTLPVVLRRRGAY